MEHLRRDTKNGYIKAILEERVELGHAIHGMFDDRHVRASFRIRVGDIATGGKFEDVGDPYPVSLLSLLHSVGEAEQLPRVAVEVFAPDCEGNMTTVAHKETRTELILELADLLRQCRLADMEPVRRSAEVKLIGHCYEVAHEAQVEVHA